MLFTHSKPTVHVLVDCNNFYVSCERVFNPKLKNRPVIVLSNNDGCIISRSNEAKILGIPMGAPFYIWRDFCEQHSVFVCSSNYTLYGDFSARIMASLKNFSPHIEIYSIDEAFLQIEAMSEDNLYQWAEQVKFTIKKWLGIPVSIGIAVNKTLAKLANEKAKKQKGIFILTASEKQDLVLKHSLVDEIWGIGKKTGAKLNQLGFHTAIQLKHANVKILRRHFNVNIERIIYELRGISCLHLEEVNCPTSIRVSRAFGMLINQLENLEQAICCYVARACEKLRQKKLRAQAIYVFLQTRSQKKHVDYSRQSLLIPFLTPCDDTVLINKQVKSKLKYIYKKHQSYYKAGVFLLDLQPKHSFNQQDCFVAESLESDKRNQLMITLDKINQKWGADKIFILAQGIKRQWQMKATQKTPAYTTNWQQLPVVKLT